MAQPSSGQAREQATNSEGASRTSKGRFNTNNVYSTDISLSMIMKLRALGLKAASQLPKSVSIPLSCGEMGGVQSYEMRC